MTTTNTHKPLTFFIASVWIVNGLFCKALNLVPRHQAIVSQILGENHSQQITLLIGLLEIIMAIWVLSQFRPKLNAIIQILIIILMNTIEFIVAKYLLLWGRFNAVFAFSLITIIYYTTFKLKRTYAIHT